MKLTTRLHGYDKVARGEIREQVAWCSGRRGTVQIITRYGHQARLHILLCFVAEAFYSRTSVARADEVCSSRLGQIYVSSSQPDVEDGNNRDGLHTVYRGVGLPCDVKVERARNVLSCDRPLRDDDKGKSRCCEPGHHGRCCPVTLIKNKHIRWSMRVACTQGLGAASYTL